MLMIMNEDDVLLILMLHSSFVGGVKDDPDLGYV